MKQPRSHNQTDQGKGRGRGTLLQMCVNEKEEWIALAVLEGIQTEQLIQTTSTSTSTSTSSTSSGSGGGGGS
jgi:hypothetical protein